MKGSITYYLEELGRIKKHIEETEISNINYDIKVLELQLLLAIVLKLYKEEPQKEDGDATD